MNFVRPFTVFSPFSLCVFFTSTFLDLSSSSLVLFSDSSNLLLSLLINFSFIVIFSLLEYPFYYSYCFQLSANILHHVIYIFSILIIAIFKFLCENINMYIYITHIHIHIWVFHFVFILLLSLMESIAKFY
jgi:hypothetical protein